MQYVYWGCIIFGGINVGFGTCELDTFPLMIGSFSIIIGLLGLNLKE